MDDDPIWHRRGHRGCPRCRLHGAAPERSTEITVGELASGLNATAAVPSDELRWQVICPFCGTRGREATTIRLAWERWDNEEALSEDPATRAVPVEAE